MKKFAKISFLVLFGFGVFLGPVSTALAQETQASAVLDDQDYTDRLRDCSIWDGSGIVACFVNLFYYVVLYPSGKFAQLTAELLDFFIAYSISSNSYGGDNGGFVSEGWGIIRDIANVLFIFLLLFIAIKHILKGADAGTKKMLISIIIAALLINFSLFFSKVVIDAGNILARAFYNNIDVSYYQPEGSSVTPISQALAEKVQPQKILSSDLFDPSNYTVPGEPTGVMPNGYAFFIMLIAAFVNVTMGITFLSVFLLFIARTVGLWFMMIFSPIAFASIAMGGGGGFFGKFGFDSWRDNILKLAFMAPIFMFFLFLSIMFLNVILGGDSVLSGETSTTQRLAGVVIPFAVVVVLLKQAKKQAQDLAGEFGTAITGAVGKLAGGAIGFAGGAALGGVAAIGRATIGARMTAIAGSEKNKEKAANNMFYRQFYKFADTTSKKNLDLRDTGLGKRSSQLLNAGLAGSGFGTADLGKGSTKGGYAQRMEAYQKEKEAFKEKLKASDSSDREVHVDAAGNVFTSEQRDRNTGQVLTRPIAKSLIEAETEFLRVQNQNKRLERPHTYQTLDKQGNVVQEDHNVDYDTWVKKRDGLEKARKQAETDYANAQRNAQRDAAGNIIRDAAFVAAERKHTFARDAHESVKDFVKGIEKTWEKEEKMFKGVQKSKNEHDTNILRSYAESVQPGGLNDIYDFATGKTGGRDARAGASANIRLAAEKEEKKAIAAEKKEDKKDK